jgi:hypothetical protein
LNFLRHEDTRDLSIRETASATGLFANADPRGRPDVGDRIGIHRDEAAAINAYGDFALVFVDPGWANPLISTF